MYNAFVSVTIVPDCMSRTRDIRVVRIHGQMLARDAPSTVAGVPPFRKLVRVHLARCFRGTVSVVR